MSYVLTHPSESNWDHSYSILSGLIKPNEPSPEYMKKFDDIICDFLREQGVPGASLYITVHGKPIYKQGYGMSGNGCLVSSSSHYRIASISKIITAIAVLKLCEQGKLHLHCNVFGKSGYLDHIEPMFPSFHCGLKSTWKPIEQITVLDLLRHSAGWDRDLVGDHVFWFQQEKHQTNINAWDNVRLVQYVISHELSFKPGERHAYSNFGYLVLGLIIEKVTGMSYEHFVKEMLREIGIEDIYVGRTTQETVNYEEVKYFNNKDPQVEVSVIGSYVAPQYGSFPMENTGAFGGLVTCAKNLVELLNQLIKLGENRTCLLSDESIAEMFAKPVYEKGEAWYGLGLDIEDNGASFGHTGAMEGTSTTVYHASNGLTWAFLLNSWAKDMDLDGVIKYALSSIYGLPMWNEKELKFEGGDYFVASSDQKQCVRILLPHKHLLDHVMYMKNKGYKISHINALSTVDDVRFNIIWQKHSHTAKDWSIIVDVQCDDFDNCLKQMKDDWKVIALESYCLTGTVYHLFVFERCPGSQQKIYVTSNFENHQRFKGHYEADQYHLQSQCVLQMGETKILSAVYDHTVTLKPLLRQSKTWTDLPIEKFMSELENLIVDGYFLRYIQFYTTDDMPKISAVWHKCVYHGKENNFFQRHDVTKYGFLYELGESMKTNRPVSFVTAYQHEDVTYFAAIWKTVLRKPHKKQSSSRENSSVNETLGESLDTSPQIANELCSLFSSPEQNECTGMWTRNKSKKKERQKLLKRLRQS